ncbi:MAG: radical SAM family heme chaperone HemW [Terricaulis sp.]
MSGFGIYVHWPYCAHLCPYCDFNVYRFRGGDHAPLLDAICADLREHASRFGRREAGSLFLGGGTPSLLAGRDIERLIEEADDAFGLAADCEVTLEANPEDVEHFAEQASAGVTRFSIGVQALDYASLKALGRRHDCESGVAAVEAAAATGERVSLDLIYAREGQGVEEWRRELTAALALPVEHVSLYQLTIEPDTAFARRVARGLLAPPDADACAEFYEVTQDVCDAAGFPAYEISNHARAPLARSRHNLLYWRSHDWLGIGPGAHGRVTDGVRRIATEAQSRPQDYIGAVNQHGIGWLTNAELSGEEIADELLLMGLRTGEGIDLKRFAELRARPINPDAITWLGEQGLLVLNDARARLTARGRLLANKIAAELAC